MRRSLKWRTSLILASMLVLLSLAALAQDNKNFAPDKMDTVLYGVAYYPEYMPYDRLDKDVEMMQKAGITVVRVGESTWSSWEPRDGEFQFTWTERVLDRLHQAGIKVILGTPTYSIPAWLYKEHPEIAVTHQGTLPQLADPYDPAYPSSMTPGFYGPRQNYDFLNRLKQKYKTPETINRIWGLVYWGQLVHTWEALPPRNGILNPGYKLEWENFQHDIVTDYLVWQARIVSEYKRTDQFITQDFSGGVHTNLDQWAIARTLDVVAQNPYFETQKRLNARGIWMSGDLARSLKHTNYLVTETNAQTIGWDSRTQYPQYPGQLRLVVYTHLAAGANMVEYWHWHSLHYGQETYWKGVLSHDLEPNRTYAEVSRVAVELKKLGPQLVDLKKENKVAILFSADSANALSYMPVSDHVNYMAVLKQMYDAL